MSERERKITFCQCAEFHEWDENTEIGTDCVCEIQTEHGRVIFESGVAEVHLMKGKR
jgi:hypothetical protein